MSWVSLGKVRVDVENRGRPDCDESRLNGKEQARQVRGGSGGRVRKGRLT